MPGLGYWSTTDCAVTPTQRPVAMTVSQSSMSRLSWVAGRAFARPQIRGGRGPVRRSTSRTRLAEIGQTHRAAPRQGVGGGHRAPAVLPDPTMAPSKRRSSSGLRTTARSQVPSARPALGELMRSRCSCVSGCDSRPPVLKGDCESAECRPGVADTQFDVCPMSLPVPGCRPRSARAGRAPRRVVPIAVGEVSRDVRRSSRTPRRFSSAASVRETAACETPRRSRRR